MASPFDFENEEAEFDLNYAVEQAQGLERVHASAVEKVLDAFLLLTEKEARMKVNGGSQYAITPTGELYTVPRPFGAIGIPHRISGDGEAAQLLQDQTVYHVLPETVTYHVSNDIPLAEIEITIHQYSGNSQPATRRYRDTCHYYDTIDLVMAGGRVFLEYAEQRAYGMKMKLIADIMQEHSYQQQKPIVFLEGPLLPQVEVKAPAHQHVYLDILHRTLLLSLGTGVPLVACVEKPYENHLALMLSQMDQACSWILTDLKLLEAQLLPMERTPAFRRNLHRLQQRPYPGCDIGFVYMRLPLSKLVVAQGSHQAHDKLENPVRFEFPLDMRWNDNPFPDIYDYAAAHTMRLQHPDKHG